MNNLFKCSRLDFGAPSTTTTGTGRSSMGEVNTTHKKIVRQKKTNRRQTKTHTHKHTHPLFPTPKTMNLNNLRATEGGPIHRSVELIKNVLNQIFNTFDLEPATDLDVAYALICLTFFGTLMSYYGCCGARHDSDRRALQAKLERAQKESALLQKQLNAVDELQRNVELEKLQKKKKEGKEIRVFVEGAFDLMHYGHANAFRQAREVGTYLVAGVNSSKTIEQAKGAPPVLTDKERSTVVRACKWVDEVIEETPYVMTPEYLNWVIETYHIDYVIHGDDPCIGPDGKDVYAHVKAIGKFRTIPRTEG